MQAINAVTFQNQPNCAVLFTTVLSLIKHLPASSRNLYKKAKLYCFYRVTVDSYQEILVALGSESDSSSRET